MTKFFVTRICIFLALTVAGNQTILAQKSASYPELEISTEWYKKHLRFLASDELQGRRAGSEGNAVAARYLAEQLQYFGLDTVEGAEGYFQQIPFLRTNPAKGGEVQVGSSNFTYGTQMVWLSGATRTLQAEALWVGNGWIDEAAGINDYEGKDANGKVVVLASGFPGASNPRAVFKATARKRVLAKEHGAIAVVEVYRERFPWSFIQREYTQDRLSVVKDPGEVLEASLIPHVFVNDPDQALEEALQGNFPVEASFQAGFQEGSEAIVNVPNVIGVISGTDPILRDEYVLLTAHFDHVGAGSEGGQAYSAEDSIFNGARDNGIGTIALLGAVRALSAQPPKRSVVCMAVNAEEMGLLGSAYYADNPLIPLNQTVFNLNTDGAGYSDTTAISILGMTRVGAEEELQAAADALGFKVYVDPAPEQNLFDRSDNVSFARKGIPAPTFSPGFDAFNPEIFKYYHQTRDEVETLNWNYVARFSRAYAHAARLIANKAERPQWIPGDKYEEAAKLLYRK